MAAAVRCPFCGHDCAPLTQAPCEHLLCVSSDAAFRHTALSAELEALCESYDVSLPDALNRPELKRLIEERLMEDERYLFAAEPERLYRTLCTLISP